MPTKSSPKTASQRLWRARRGQGPLRLPESGREVAGAPRQAQTRSVGPGPSSPPASSAWTPQWTTARRWRSRMGMLRGAGGGGCCRQHGAGPRRPGWRRADMDTQHGAGVSSGVGLCSPSGPGRGQCWAHSVQALPDALGQEELSQGQRSRVGPLSTARLFLPATHLGKLQAAPPCGAEGASPGTRLTQGLPC